MLLSLGGFYALQARPHSPETDGVTARPLIARGSPAARPLGGFLACDTRAGGRRPRGGARLWGSGAPPRAGRQPFTL